MNHLGSYGRWAFTEFTDVWAMQDEFEAELEAHFDRMIEAATGAAPAVAG